MPLRPVPLPRRGRADGAHLFDGGARLIGDRWGAAARPWRPRPDEIGRDLVVTFSCAIARQRRKKFERAGGVVERLGAGDGGRPLGR